MLPSEMNKRERAEYPMGRCGGCGIRILTSNRWDGDDYGYDLLCDGCGSEIQAERALRSTGTRSRDERFRREKEGR